MTTPQTPANYPVSVYWLQLKAADGVAKPSMIEEGIYRYPDPSYFDRPDTWSPEYPPSDPLPDEIEAKNPDTAYHPPIDISAVTD